MKTQQSAKYSKPLRKLIICWLVSSVFIFECFPAVSVHLWYIRIIAKLMILFILNTHVDLFFVFSPLELNRIMVEWLNKVHSMHSDHSKLWQPQEMLILREMNKSFCFAKFSQKFLKDILTEDPVVPLHGYFKSMLL